MGINARAISKIANDLLPQRWRRVFGRLPGALAVIDPYKLLGHFLAREDRLDGALFVTDGALLALPTMFAGTDIRPSFFNRRNRRVCTLGANYPTVHCFIVFLFWAHWPGDYVLSRPQKARGQPSALECRMLEPNLGEPAGSLSVGTLFQAANCLPGIMLGAALMRSMPLW